MRTNKAPLVVLSLGVSFLALLGCSAATSASDDSGSAVGTRSAFPDVAGAFIPDVCPSAPLVASPDGVAVVTARCAAGSDAVIVRVDAQTGKRTNVTALDAWTVFGRAPNGFYVARWSPDELRAELWSWDLASHITVTTRSVAPHNDPAQLPVLDFTPKGDAVAITAAGATWMATVPPSGAAAATLVEGGAAAGTFVAFDGEQQRALFLRTDRSNPYGARNYVESHAIADGRREASTELPTSDVRYERGSAFKGYALFAQASPSAWFAVRIADATFTTWKPAFCAGKTSCSLPYAPPFAGVRSETGLPRSFAGGQLLDMTGDPMEPVRVVGPSFAANFTGVQTDSALFLLQLKAPSQLVSAASLHPVKVSTLSDPAFLSRGEALGSLAVLRSGSARTLRVADASGATAELKLPPTAAAQTDAMVSRFQDLSCAAPSSDGGAYLIEQPVDGALAPTGPTVVWKLTAAGAPQQVSTIAWATPASGALKCDFVKTPTGVVARVLRTERFPGKRAFEQAVLDLH